MLAASFLLGLAARVDGEGVDCEEVDCECLADLLLSRGIDHFIHTLTALYQVKVNWEGSKYLGMDININRTKRHVTLTMPGYIQKLLLRVRPNGIKGASTPAIYAPPNYAIPGAQKATIDDSPFA